MHEEAFGSVAMWLHVRSSCMLCQMSCAELHLHLFCLLISCHMVRDGCLRDGHEDDHDNEDGAKLAQHSHSGSWRHQTCTNT